MALDPGLLPQGLPIPEIFRGLAQNCIGAAGLAQLRVIRQVRRRAL